MSFYLLFPLLLLLLKKYIPNPKFVSINALFFWFCTQIVLFYLLNTGFYQGFPSKSHDLIYYFPVAHFCSFLLGIAGAYWLRSFQYIKLSVFTSISLMLLSLITIVFCFEKQQLINTFFNINIPYGGSYYARFFLLMIIAFSVSNSRVASILSIKPFVVLGEISFAVYIMQVPVWSVVFYILNKKNLSHDYILLFYIIILLSAGALLTKYAENPIKDFVHSRFT
jgi:peptidoglycan/LPS O-acetylase OafA/YrhL